MYVCIDLFIYFFFFFIIPLKKNVRNDWAATSGNPAMPPTRHLQSYLTSVIHENATDLKHDNGTPIKMLTHVLGKFVRCPGSSWLNWKLPLAENKST